MSQSQPSPRIATESGAIAAKALAPAAAARIAPAAGATLLPIAQRRLGAFASRLTAVAAVFAVLMGSACSDGETQVTNPNEPGAGGEAGDTTPAHCSDGQQNEDETDLDCGGSCNPCAEGNTCSEGSDCVDGICEGDECIAASCSDDVANGGESDVDCGGSDCAPCGIGEACEAGEDCSSTVCSDGACVASACEDGVANGDETDVDCGGSCAPCAAGGSCASGDDCAGAVCSDGTCADASCGDGVANGDETDVDCGGSCAPCGATQACSSGGDCADSICTDRVCVAGTCSDSVHNGSETDTDCGGSCETKCTAGQQCTDGDDCLDGLCSDGQCLAASCGDGLRNGDETDVDCGGSCGGCAADAICVANADCADSVCDGGACAQASCSDGAKNGGETDVDCGGSCETQCAPQQACAEAGDCLSGVCSDGVCATATCSDGVANGDEADADCGGSCDAKCTTDQLCSTGADCADGVCTGDTCAAASCSDGAENGSETDVDCGGSCETKCTTDQGCTEAADCADGVCTDGACAAPSCSDGAKNGGETDVDCGGASCDACGRGLACSVDADCASSHCIGELCVVGPTAGFSVSDGTGSAPLLVTATSTAQPGDGAIVTVEYDFGNGGGFGDRDSATYLDPGSFEITQRVTDDNGITAEATAAVVVGPPAPAAAVFLSETDRSASPELQLTSDRLGVDIRTGDNVGVRSERPVLPETGFFYYEVQNIGRSRQGMYTGLVSADFDLLGEPGADTASVGLDLLGGVQYGGAFVGAPDESAFAYGLAIDYRDVTPTVYVIAQDELIATVDMPEVDDALYVYLGGRRTTVGPQARVNLGNDVVNVPFDYEPADILSAAGVDTTGLVLGFGQSLSPAFNAPPSLDVSGGGAVPFGSSITLTATATDPEDGNLAAAVVWSDLSLPYTDRPNATGGSITFAPNSLGIHPIEAVVEDSLGRTARVVVDVEVTGTLPTVSTVQLEPDGLSGAGIELDAAGLQAHFTGFNKYGIRANQGLLDGFQYFEVHRLGPVASHGVGLVIENGNLNPYSTLDVPPSCSLNMFASFWHDLISVADFDTAATEYYGLAVDYRGRHPLVYFITQNTAGEPVFSFGLELDDVTVPIFPMVYGDPDGSPEPYDLAINFGATPFHFDPAAVLSAEGVDVSELQVSWGPPPP